MSEGSAEGKVVQKNNKKMIAVFVIIILLLLAAVASLIFVFVHAQKEDDLPGSGSIRGVVTNVDEAKAMLDQMRNEKMKQGYFETEMTNNWVFATGTSASENAYVGNASSNLHPMYFDLVLDGTGETIYSSPVVPVGAHVDNIVLDKNLPAGDYHCVMTHHFLDDNYIETGETVNLGINFTINQ